MEHFPWMVYHNGKQLSDPITRLQEQRSFWEMLRIYVRQMEKIADLDIEWEILRSYEITVVLQIIAATQRRVVMCAIRIIRGHKI